MGIREVANSLGYVGDDIDLLFVLDLPLPEAKLAELKRWAAEKSAGYQAVTWRGLAPREWREAYVLLHILEEFDYPDDDFERQHWTADLLDAILSRELSNGGELITTLIVDGDGAPAAGSRLTVKGPARTSAENDHTIVLGAHRGHRLSALAKVGNLRRLGRDFPQVGSLHTDVAVENEAMWVVNDRIGFRSNTPPLVD
jgi:hypothetical protein